MPTYGTVFAFSMPCPVIAHNPTIKCGVSFGQYAEHVKQMVFGSKFCSARNFYCLFAVINVSVVVNYSFSFGS